MFQNYIKIAWRNLLRSKGYSCINIGGLALGMAVAVLNGLWIWDELSFNKNHDNYERIAQVAVSGMDKGERWVGTTMAYPLGTKLINSYKEDFKHIVRTSWNSEQILSFAGKSLAGSGYYVDEEAPEMFTFKMIHGSRAGLKNTHSSDALPKIEAVFKKVIPSAPFDYRFVDEEYAAKFAAEEQIAKLTTFFGVLAIFISCLGLFGLAAYVAEQRTKEIGIRQVLGASVANLWGLLSREFIVLVVISCFIAVPISSIFMVKWLENFNYRTDLSEWVFAGASFGALLIALITVSFQTLKAALTNPVDSLRSE